MPKDDGYESESAKWQFLGWGDCHIVLQGPAQMGVVILLHVYGSPDHLFVQQNEPFLP